MSTTDGQASIPEVVILRLPLYVRVLTHFRDEGTEVVSSRELGDRLGVTPAQIRKDLSYFGRFGKQGRGYNVSYLVGELRSVLGLDREWKTAVVGVGRLGRAIINYPGFEPEGFKVVAAFDADPAQVGRKFHEITVRATSELPEVVIEEGIDIAIVAVPSSMAQDVIDELVGCGIKAILNYAPVAPQVPEDVRVRNIDPVLGLQTMTYHLKEGKTNRSRR
ncbi:MAG: redox-sensing transcriptional repressor Rex [Chloroflexi bacterium]|nr:redox-sensing transcriptional repressor Rex [Chloroflexota bacterium]